MFLELFKGRISFPTQGPTGRREVTSLCGGGGALNTSPHNLLEAPLSTPAQSDASSVRVAHSPADRTVPTWAPGTGLPTHGSPLGVGIVQRQKQLTLPCSCHQVPLPQQLGLDLQLKAAILSISSWATLFTFTEQTSQETL